VAQISKVWIFSCPAQPHRAANKHLASEATATARILGHCCLRLDLFVIKLVVFLLHEGSLSGCLPSQCAVEGMLAVFTVCMTQSAHLQEGLSALWVCIGHKPKAAALHEHDIRHLAPAHSQVSSSRRLPAGSVQAGLLPCRASSGTRTTARSMTLAGPLSWCWQGRQ
jgi:hypothetical protein